MRLFIASFFTLGLLFMLFFALILTVFYITGFFDWYVLIGLTILVNFLFWLIGPYISDFVYRYFYKLNWIGIEGLEKKNQSLAKFVRECCKRNNIKVPKIGYIDDDNPTSFTYGSGAFNARIVVTKGLFTYLETKEIKTVLAHELGHVVHRDFIVMAIASVIIQLFYEIYRISLRFVHGSKKKSGTLLLLASAIGYVFYIIGIYIVLFLNRIREYYADEFAAQETNDPNSLSMALIKIAYGIIKNPEDKRGLDLLKTTRAYNIFDFKIAKTVGLAYLNAAEQRDWAPIEGAILFDMYNPWAFVSELSSSHPLTGKRIDKLSKIAIQFKQSPYFNVEQIMQKYKVDMSRFYVNFGRDLFFLLIPYILILSYLGLVFVGPMIGISVINFSLLNIFGFVIFSFGLSALLMTLYSYRTGSGFPKNTVAGLMSDIYTSPIRGKPTKLNGVIVGRGIPGLIFSEDMMFRDSTGLIYLNYESLIPLFGNLIFALTKVKELMGKQCEIDGWFVRSLYHRIELNKIYVDGKEIKSRVRLIGILIAIILLVIGAFILLL